MSECLFVLLRRKPRPLRGNKGILAQWTNGRLPKRDYRSKSSFYDLKQWVNKRGVLVCCCWQHLCHKHFVGALFESNETVWKGCFMAFPPFMYLWRSWTHIHSFWHALHVFLWGMKVFRNSTMTGPRWWTCGICRKKLEMICNANKTNDPVRAEGFVNGGFKLHPYAALVN